MSDEFATPRERKEAFATMADYCRSRDDAGLARLIWDRNHQQAVFASYRGNVGEHSLTIIKVAAERATAPLDLSVGWKPISEEAKEAGRILLVWPPFGGIAEHIELGRWSKDKGVWVNTYGNAFSYPPEQWSPLAPYNPWGHVPCPCTLIEQDEDCPVGYPSLLCGVCEGTGNTTAEQVAALACEMIKIASDIGGPEDPFAAWESVDLIKSQHGQLRNALQEHVDACDADDCEMCHRHRALLSTTEGSSDV